MIPGSLAVMSGAAAPPAPSFDPATLFAAGEKGAWWDAAAWATTAFQDSAGATPVTAAGQPVGRLLDRSGRGNHVTQSTAGARPTLEIASGVAGVLSDGFDDLLSTGASIYNVLNDYSPWEAFVVFRYNSVGTNSGNPWDNVAIVGDSNGVLEIAFARSSGVIGVAGGGGGSTNATVSASVTSRNVFHGRLAAANLAASINGGAESTVAGTSTPAAGTLRLLRGWSGGTFSNARFHEIILRGVAMTPTQRTDCINYLKSKWGVA